jgi:hypothetical protein
MGLSLGLVTLWMTIVGFWKLNATLALPFPLIVSLVGILPGVRRRPSADVPAHLPPRTLVQRTFSALLAGDLRAWLTLAALGSWLAVLCHSTYYPFIDWDEFRYAQAARLIFFEGHVGRAARGYPQLMTMAYAYVFFATGQLAEQLARVVPALLSGATLLATFALGRRLFGSRAGYAAVFVLVACPLYLRYSPHGYVDIPSALFFVLSAYAADVWRIERRLRWAILTGICVGLALWTKMAGFLALGSLGMVWAAAIAGDALSRNWSRMLKAVRDGLVVLVTGLLTGGWWYLRNAYYDGWREAVFTPGSFYTSQARHGLRFLFPFLGYTDGFGYVASAACLVGLAWALSRPGHALWPLMWAVPYTLVWYWLYSYDARLLLPVLPFYAILFGGLAEDPESWPCPSWLRAAVCIGIVAAVGVAVVRAGLNGVRQWVVAPKASYAERLYRAPGMGGSYSTVEFLRAHVPATARIMTMDSRMLYYLIGREVSPSYPTRLAELVGIDYLVSAKWGPSVYAGFGAADNEILRAMADGKTFERVYVSPQEDFVVYRIPKP